MTTKKRPHVPMPPHAAFRLIQRATPPTYCVTVARCPPSAMHTPHSEQVQANEAYQLLPMPVPAVLVTLHGAQGGLLLDEGTGKEVGYVRTSSDART